jgi:ribosomal protein S12 methylthiotransferase
MKNKTIHMTTLGCDKNSIDSEMMLGLIQEKQYRIEADPQNAEIIIVNTCCFIQSAKEQSIEYILEFTQHKISGKCKLLIVAGCMAERYHKELNEEIPEIDGFLGVGHFDNILDLINSFEDVDCNSDRYIAIRNHYLGDIDKEILSAKRYIAQGTVSTYVRVSEGCNHHCTYCAIPKIRGKYRSRKIQDLFIELKDLEARGIKEIILIGQDIAPYGTDLDDGYDLPDLLEKISLEFKFKWIRMMYLYPEGVTTKLLTIVSKYPAICQYFDLPLQHTNDAILKQMGRKMTFDQIQNAISQIRTLLPQAVLRTSIITGFPGESSADHEELLNRIQTLAFDHLGVFKYSQEEGTPAENFENQVAEEEKEKRYHEIMITQQKISHSNKSRFIGMTMDVLIEEKEDETYLGRFYGDAPDIDGIVYVNSEGSELTIGNFYPVKMITALEYDLIGDIANELTK